MNIPINEVVHFDVVTSDPATGAAIDADSEPTFEVFEEGTDTDIAGGTMTKRTGRTGNYRDLIAVTASAGFEIGKFYNVVASATVAGVTGKTVVLAFRVIAAEAIAGYQKTDLQYVIGNDQGSALNILLTDYGSDNKISAQVVGMDANTLTASAMASDAVAEINAAIASQISTDHGSGSYARNTEPLDAAGVRTAVGLSAADLDDQLDGLSGDIGNVTVKVTPIAVTVSAGEVSGQELVTYQYCGFSFLLTITDDNGDPIDLEGKTVSFVVHDLESPTAEVFELTTASGVTVVGASHNQVALAGTSATTQAAGSFRWFLKDVTDASSAVPLGEGSFTIRETPADA